MRAGLLENEGGARAGTVFEDAPGAAVSKAALPGFRVHTAALLEKNWRLKRQRWTGDRIEKCPCAFGRPCCFPCGFFCEVIFPLLVLLPMCYTAYSCIHPSYECDTGCASSLVGGWGGSIPQALQKQGITQCNQPDVDPNNPPPPPPPPPNNCYNGGTSMSCSAWTDSGKSTQIGSFLQVMLSLQAAGLKLAWVTEDAKDRPKLNTMIKWVSKEWYPGLGHVLPQTLNSSDIAGDGSNPKKMCYERIIGQSSNNILGYGQNGKWGGDSGSCSQYGNNDPNDPACCMGADILGSFADLQMPTLQTVADLNNYLDHFDYDYADAGGPGLIWGAVVFHSLGSTDGSPGSPGDWEYTIRLNSSNVPDTGSVLTLTGCADQYGGQLGCSGGNVGYGSSNGGGYGKGQGFMAMQLMIDRYIIHADNSQSVTSSAALSKNMESNLRSPTNDWARMLGSSYSGQAWRAWLSESNHDDQLTEIIATPLKFGPETLISTALPVPDAEINSFYDQTLQFFGLFFVIGFLYTMYGVVVELIMEKQTKIRESLKMMGVGTESLLASFYLLHGFVFGVLCLVLSVYLTLLPADYAILPASSPIVVFVFLWLWCMAFVAFAFAFHTFWNRAMAGGLVSALVMLVQFVVYALLTMTSVALTGPGLYALSLFPNCALCLGLSIITRLESIKTGAGLSNLFAPVHQTSMGGVMGFLLLDIVFWTALGWYLEQVLPKEFGVQLPPWFLCDPAYWTGKPPSLGTMCANCFEARMTDRLTDTLGMQRATSADIEALARDEAIEEVSSSLQSCIEIRNLRKVFKTPAGPKVAVDSLSLDCYENQILCLLGHNGAGKTTTINILTGMCSPTGGEASILGYDIRSEMPQIRKSIGCCPQHDVLWAKLTVQQHLETFAKLKGLDPATCVGAKIGEVGLTEKVNVPAGQLSGGMKRKLSLCMALIGDAKVIFLDEPTSGMDPFSRRSTWNMLIANKVGRAMVLTTHFMDEADLLGDRVAIMAEGRLQCCGSSLFLKNRFGAGYRLICTRKMQARCDANAIEAMLQTHVPQAKLLTDVGAEMTYQLPTEGAKAFPNMLRQLDEQLEQLGVAEYGVSQVTMEEVFLKVGKSATEAASGGTEASLERSTSATDTPLRLTDMRAHEVFMRHLAATTVKRVHYGRRDIATIFCSLMVPAFMLWGCIALVKSQENYVAPRLVLDATQFDRYTDHPILPWNSTDDRVAVLTPFAGHALHLPATPSTKFFGRTYDPTDGLPSNPNDNNPHPTDRTQGGYGGSEPERILAMDEAMWASGLGVESEQVQWGGLLFPGPTDFAHDAVTVLVNLSAAHAVPTFASAATNALRRRHSPGETGQITVVSQPLPTVGDEAKYTEQAFNAIFVVILVIAFAFVPSAIVAFPVMEAEAHHNSRHQQYISGVSIPAYWLANYAWDLSLYLVLMLTSIISFQAFDVKVFTVQHCSDCTSDDSYGGVCSYGLGWNRDSYSWTTTTAELCREITNSSSSITCDFQIPATPQIDPNGYSDGYVPPGATLDVLCPSSCGTCGPGPFGLLVWTLLGYGFAIIPVTYMFSLAFKKHTTAQMVTLLANIVFGLLLVLTSFALAGSKSTKGINDALQPLFRISPGFNLGWSVFQMMSAAGGGMSSRPADAPPLGPDLMQWERCGANLFALFIVGATFLPLVMLVDYVKNNPSVMSKLPLVGDAQIPEVANYVPDADVQAEEARVLASPIPRDGQPHEDVIHIRNLRKVYGSGSKAKVAVRALTLGLRRGTCFGFLGINGAGKTSTMNILTGAQSPSSGDAWLGSKNILTQQKEVRRLIGYCPQHDALLDKLSVREHLVLFGRIKGVTAQQLEKFVIEMMESLDLKQHEHKLASTLSGGNKRKLSVGIALMGSPQLVFLDEPSTGVDPAARRFMWDIISRLSTQRQECTVLLTTHNMEEAEALCSTIGIMVGGRLRCLGSNQRLKVQFGQGYQLELKLRVPSEAAVATLVGEKQLPPVLATHETVVQLCERLGDAARGALIREGCEQGYAMYSTLQQSGQVTAAQFAQWWLAENSSRELVAQLNAAFGDKVELLESHDRSYRFRVQMRAAAEGVGGTTVASVFETMEQRVGSAVDIEEYGLSQASLEQIFNQFAAEQEEETASVRGMQQATGGTTSGTTTMLAAVPIQSMVAQPGVATSMTGAPWAPVAPQQSSLQQAPMMAGPNQSVEVVSSGGGGVVAGWAPPA